MILITAKVLDFSATSNHTGLIIGLVLASIILIFGVVFSFIEYDILIFFVSILIASLALVLSMMGGSREKNDSFNAEQISILKEWSSDTYLLNLTTGQASDILKNQVDLKSKAEDNADKIPILAKNSYGEIVTVTLVKDGKDYMFIQSGFEVPAATIKK